MNNGFWDSFWDVVPLFLIGLLVVLFFVTQMPVKSDVQIKFNDNVTVAKGFYEGCTGVVQAFNYSYNETYELTRVNCKNGITVSTIKVPPAYVERLP